MQHFPTKILLAILVLSFGSDLCRAQNLEDNLAKYWLYRNFYKKQFIVVGDNAGESIPFAAYYPNEDLSYQGTWNHQLECYPIPSGMGALTTGDATLQIGIYLGILATEYALLKKAGYATTGTEQEIYFAIKAFERIDLAAEEYFGNPEANDASFFLRDDIPYGFTKDEQGAYFIPSYLATNPNDTLIHVVKGDFTCANLSEERKYPGVTSQDQVAHLSVGFTLLQRYLNEEAEYQGVPLKAYGRTVYRRMYDAFKANGFVAGKPVQLPASWRLDYRSLIQAGYPFKRVINLFYGGNEFNPGTDRTNWINIFLPGYLLSPDKPYNWAMGLIWASIGDAVSSENWLAQQTKDRHLELYALLHACIHDKPVGNALSESDFMNLLNSAPCNPPCKDGNTGCPTPDNVDWNVGYRWTNNSRNSDQGWQRGFFNGADYMLLYNLFHLKYLQEETFYPPATPPCDFFSDVPFDSIPRVVSTAQINYQKAFSLSCFPHPASSVLNVRLPDDLAGASAVLRILDVSGREVRSLSVSSMRDMIEVSVEALPKQMYFLELQTNGQRYVGKFVKF
jgi:hypothetical protein